MRENRKDASGKTPKKQKNPKAGILRKRFAMVQAVSSTHHQQT
jgi:hypothetical protein